MSFLGSLLLNSGVEKNHVEIKITEKKQESEQLAWKPNQDGKMPEIIEVL